MTLSCFNSLCDAGHIKVTLDTFNILAIYITSSNDIDKIEFFNDKLAHLVDSNTIIVGDFNLNLCTPTTPKEHQMLDRLYTLGQIYVDKPLDYSFYRETSTGPQQSNIDHITGPSDQLHQITEVNNIRINITEHSLLLFTVTNDSLPAYEKESKIKSYKLKDHHEKYQADLVATYDDIKFNTLLSQVNTNDPSTMRRNMNRAYSYLTKSIIDSAEKICGTTTPNKEVIVSTSDLIIGQHILDNGINDEGQDMANSELIRSRNQWRFNLNKKNSMEVVKTVAATRSHNFKTKSNFDVNKRNEYGNIWAAKWLSPTGNHTASININHNTGIHSIPITLDTINEQLAHLKCGKSPGLDQITYEMLKYLPISLKKALQSLFIKILITGIFPQAFIEFAVVPIPKRGDLEDINNHRPISLSSCIRKLLEGIGLQHLRIPLETSRRQYGFKKKCSVLDAAIDAHDAILDPKYKGWHIFKLDVNAAFDCISREAILNAILNLDCEDYWKAFLWNLVQDADLYLKFGPYLSHKINTSRGIIQGGKLSPNLFTKTLDIAIGDWNYHHSTLFQYADDIFILIKPGYITAALNLLKSKLATIGLGINGTKTEEITSTQLHVYLGFVVSTKGTSAAAQIKRNISSTRNATRQLSLTGLFRRSGIKLEHLLKSVQIFLLPKLEFGIAIFKPTQSLADKINTFILSHIRLLSGSSMDTKKDDLYSMFGFTDFFTRWTSLHLKFHNHRCQFTGTGHPLYSPKKNIPLACPMLFMR